MKDPKSLRLLLVDTNPPWVHGSMDRYARLVEEATRECESTFSITFLNVALPFNLPARLNSGLATWLNHTWMVLTAGWRIRRHRPHIVHLLDGSHAYLLTSLGFVRRMATVHDLIPLISADTSAARQNCGWLSGRLITWSVRGLQSCERLAADSHHTAGDLARHAGIPHERIDVVHVALDPGLVKLAEQGSGRTELDQWPDRPYLLHIGSDAWYKNREGVVRIFAAVVQAVDTCLILAGTPPSAALRQLIRSVGIEDRVQFVTIRSDEDMATLYRNASVFVFPSLYEGFGWPPLEAMAFSCPVVCSNEASLPEVVGDAALMQPARDEEGLAAHCISVLTDAGLASRLRQLGLARSAQFTLERMVHGLYSCWGSRNGTQR